MTGAGAPLPGLVVVTDGAATGGRPLLDVVGAAAAGGARAVLLREKHLGFEARSALAREVAGLLAGVGGTLLVASDPAVAGGVAAGVHLSASQAVPSPAPAVVGRSCHSAAEVVKAAADGCGYATLSPVFATASKPGYGPALGVGALAGHPVPVWALGGVDATNAAACVAAGAAGVAVMGALMRAPDPGAAAAAILAALRDAG